MITFLRRHVNAPNFEKIFETKDSRQRSFGFIHKNGGGRGGSMFRFALDKF